MAKLRKDKHDKSERKQTRKQKQSSLRGMNVPLGDLVKLHTESLIMLKQGAAGRIDDVTYNNITVILADRQIKKQNA